MAVSWSSSPIVALMMLSRGARNLAALPRGSNFRMLPRIGMLEAVEEKICSPGRARGRWSGWLAWISLTECYLCVQHRTYAKL